MNWKDAMRVEDDAKQRRQEAARKIKEAEDRAIRAARETERKRSS